MAGKCVSVHAYKFTAARGAVIAFFGCKHLFFHCLKLVCPVRPLRLARPFTPYNCRSSDIFSSRFDSLSLSPAVHPCVFSSFCSNIKTDFPLKRTLLLFPAAVWAPFNAWTFLSFLLIDQFMSTQRGSDGRRQRRHWLLSEHFAKEAQVSGPQCKANKEINFFSLHFEIDDHETVNVLRGSVQPVFPTLTPWWQSLRKRMRLINLLLIPSRNFVQCPAH